MNKNNKIKATILAAGMAAASWLPSAWAEPSEAQAFARSLELARLLRATIAVESGGNPDARGDKGRAVGLLQIHKVMVDDVNRVAKTNFTWPADCLDPEKSKAMWRIYQRHYSPHASLEVIARRWNGGPLGEGKAATEAYWQKIKAAL